VLPPDAGEVSTAPLVVSLPLGSPPVVVDRAPLKLAELIQADKLSARKQVASAAIIVPGMEFLMGDWGEKHCERFSAAERPSHKRELSARRPFEINVNRNSGIRFIATNVQYQSNLANCFAKICLNLTKDSKKSCLARVNYYSNTSRRGTEDCTMN
jgi:hypothetical protein